MPATNVHTSDQKIPVLMTGANGLVGSVFVRDFGHRYAITNLDLSGSPSVDITNGEQIDHIFANHPAEWVVHCAAFTDVTAAWQQTGDTSGLAYQVNVVGTENIAKACARYHKKILHLSTAYVFSGEHSEPYKEEDSTGPVEWYGQTKLLAETVIEKHLVDWVILRIDNPFRRDAFTKPDIVRRIITKLNDHTLPPQFADAFFGPTCIEDVARVIDWAIRSEAQGLYHATAGERWTPYDFAREVAQKVGINPETITAGSLDEYLRTAGRPYPKNTSLNCSKLMTALDFKLQSVHDAIVQLQIEV